MVLKAFSPVFSRVPTDKRDNLGPHGLVFTLKRFVKLRSQPVQRIYSVRIIPKGNRHTCVCARLLACGSLEMYGTPSPPLHLQIKCIPYSIFSPQEHLVRHQFGVTWKQLCTQHHHIAHTHAHALQSLLKDRTLSFSKIPGRQARELAYSSTVLNTGAHYKTVLYTSSAAFYHRHCHPFPKPPSHQMRLKSVSHNEQQYKVKAGC